MRRTVKAWVHRDANGRVCCAVFQRPSKWYRIQPGTVRPVTLTYDDGRPAIKRRAKRRKEGK